MSKIIYMKDILLTKAPEKKKKKRVGRPKLKPFQKDEVKEFRPTLKSSLIEQNRKPR